MRTSPCRSTALMRRSVNLMSCPMRKSTGPPVFHRRAARRGTADRCEIPASFTWRSHRPRDSRGDRKTVPG